MTRLLIASQLADIGAKLERANESIQNLNSEIIAFLKPPEGGFSQNKVEAVNQFTAHARRAVPVRFGVLIGEICQHLRSSLDYIVWDLSSEDYRRSNENAIAFPICLTKPSTKDEIRSYERKIKGIQSPDALKLIEQLQPYNAADPAREPLAIIHALNRIDKHRALVLVTAPFQARITLPQPNWRQTPIGIWEAEHDVSALGTNDQVKLEFSQYVAVAEIGEWKNEAIIPLLTHLLNAVRKDVGLFDSD
jgi:hypothetical protein